jgi:microcystin degradation protein MlrC
VHPLPFGILTVRTSMARIAVAGFHHETNCFVTGTTDFAYFTAHRDRPPLVRGADVIKWLADTSFALSGFLKTIDPHHEIVPLVWTSGGAGGLVTADAFERIAGELIGRLSAAMPVDAVYLDLHGAMVTEPFEDGEGELLRRVRAAVGEGVPVVISLDYHANVTPQMVAMTDGLLGYRTYPHVDRRETGAFAAQAMALLIERGRPPGRALRKLPFLIPLNDQCTMVEPSSRAPSSPRMSRSRCHTSPVSRPPTSPGAGPRSFPMRGVRRRPTAPPTRWRARWHCGKQTSRCPCSRPRPAFARP